MPYVVCVNLPGCLPEAAPYAVATLDEARDEADLTVRRCLDDGSDPSDESAGWGAPNASALCDAAQTIPETGGVIGPMHDGYVVDVRQVGAPELISLMVDRGDDHADVPEGDLEDLIDAYNQASE